MRVEIIAEGKLRDAGLRRLVDEYYARIRRVSPLVETELRDASEFARRVPRDALVVALEVDGEALTSAAFAARLEAWGRRDKGVIAFLIGGAEGLPEAVSRAAAYRLSLSSMTLPHRLARLLLAEQLYRGFSILRGEPYAREG